MMQSDLAPTASLTASIPALAAGTQTDLHLPSLALVEMKILLQEIYTRFQTRIAPDMTGSMEIYDQILSSRPRDQTCKLTFHAIWSPFLISLFM